MLADVVFLAAVISGVIAVQTHRRAAHITVGLGILAALFLAWNTYRPAPSTLVAESVVQSLLLLVLIVSILGDVLRTRRVTMNTVYGAGCVYLMMGLLWGALYTIVEIADPGSFGNVRGVEDTRFTGLTYFSFVTLTTLGYGDITPRSPTAAVLAILEALIGQLYLVILVARLVSLQATHLERSRD